MQKLCMSIWGRDCESRVLFGSGDRMHKPEGLAVVLSSWEVGLEARL